MRTMLRCSLLAFAVYLPLTLSTISAGSSAAGPLSAMRTGVAIDAQAVVPVSDRSYRSYSDDDDYEDDLDDLPPPRQSYGYGYFDRPVVPPAPVYGSYGYAARPQSPRVYDEPPLVQWAPPPRPSSCGQYRYWDGERCADARWQPPYIGPRW